MRYSAVDYAHAFSELALAAKTPGQEQKLINNFIAAVDKNGDLNAMSKITAEIERLLRNATGRDLWEVESARKLKSPVREILSGIAKDKDIIRESIDPALVAGVRITRNGESQLDASLVTRLNHLFPAA